MAERPTGVTVPDRPPGVAERSRDIAHLGHAELLTPKPEESLAYFTSPLGLWPAPGSLADQAM